MNWNSVKKDTPKAFKKFAKWVDAESKDILQFELMMILKNERDLYDFFDEMGVFICILPAFSGWDWEVYVDDEWIDSSDIKNENRKEAEEEAFKRAFFILEKQ